MLSKVTIASALVAATSALPNAIAPGYYSAYQQLACFDSLTGPPVALTQIGQYFDLYFQGIYLVPTFNLPIQPGVKPNTPSNMAGFNLINLATLNGPPTISTEKADSNVDFFDLESFYYGCVIPTQETVASLPVSCDITVTGFSDTAGTMKTCEQSFEYRVDGVPSAVIGGTPIGEKPVTVSKEMMKATLGAKFKGLKKVMFSVQGKSPVSGVLTAALLDSISYTSYTKYADNQVLSVAQAM
ncbi:hypothetical protein Ptr902_07505 [Pyrenophora tritici-repentis]|nr:hypothetical protein Ptr902_13580 [Pyrenophora tritici-repentis]KAI2481710.1 hypothetical protein Ptr902_07505 [Pyrenophora tritici-repentis]